MAELHAFTPMSVSLYLEHHYQGQAVALVLLVGIAWCEVDAYLRLTYWGRDIIDAIFAKCVFLNENVWISIKISLKFIPTDPINKISALVQIMAWRRPGDKPLSEPMMVCLMTYICVILPQWVKVSHGLMANNIYIPVNERLVWLHRHAAMVIYAKYISY